MIIEKIIETTSKRSMINLLMVRNELGETRVCILVNGDQEETWSFEPRK